LLSAGGDVNARNAAGESALIAAADRGNSEIVETLLKKGGNPSLSATHPTI
jgi:ankyrin repeat protein